MKKKFEWTVERIWTLPMIVFMVWFAIFKQDSPAYETVGILGGFIFLIWFLLKEGEWI